MPLKLHRRVPHKWYVVSSTDLQRKPPDFSEAYGEAPICSSPGEGDLETLPENLVFTLRRSLVFTALKLLDKEPTVKLFGGADWDAHWSSAPTVCGRV